MNELFAQFPDTDFFNYVILPFLIFCARIADVTLGTFRIVMVAKGQKYIAPILGFFEVAIWIIVISKIMQSMDNWVCIIAYAAGFATGNYIGLIIEDKIAMGVVKIQIITAKSAINLMQNLVDLGFGITHHEANGANGKVSIIYSIINRKQIPQIVDLIFKHNPNAFYSIEDVKFVNKGILPVNKKGLSWRKGK
jgi:uncharacterized protein YebE (UPF0316 family)